VSNAVAGGYLFRSRIFEVPEAATNPLKLYSIFQATVAVRQSGFQCFADFIYDDVLSMSRVDQEFNLFQQLVINGRDAQTSEVIKKVYTLEEVINGRNSFYSEIREAVEKKLKISLRIWLRIRSLDKSDGSFEPSTRQGLGLHNLVVHEDAYVYVKTEKVYVLHLVEKRPDGKVNFISYTHSPLCAVLEGVFQTREAA